MSVRRTVDTWVEAVDDSRLPLEVFETMNHRELELPFS